VLHSFAASITNEKVRRTIVALVVWVLLGFYEMIVVDAKPERRRMSSHGTLAQGATGMLGTGNEAYEVLKGVSTCKLENPLRADGMGMRAHVPLTCKAIA
jgi:hypothetical protein